MAIAYRAISNIGPGNGGNSSSVSKPTGVVDSDVMLMIAYVEPRTITISPPAGWTSVTSLTQTNGDFKFEVFWKRAGSEGSSYTVTHTSSTWRQISIIAFSGVIAGGTPTDGSSTATADSSATVSPGSFNTTVDNTELVLVGANWGDSTATWPSGFTERQDGNQVEVAHGAGPATAGATGSKTITFGTSGHVGGIMVALKPDTGGSVMVVAGVAQVAAVTAGPTVVLGSVTIAAGVAQVAAVVVDPTVRLGSLVIIGGPAQVAAVVGDPAVILGSLTIGGGVAQVAAVVADPAVVLSGGAEGIGCVALLEAARDGVSLAEAIQQAVALAEAVEPAITLAETRRDAVTVSDASCL